MKKVSIVGHYGFGKNLINGQSIKTKMLINELMKLLDNDEIEIIDTHNWIKSPIRLLVKCCISVKKSKNIMILPAHNGVRVFVPLITIVNKIFKRKIHYVVIGGWLSEYLNSNKWLIKYVRNIDYIYVETTTMRKTLIEMGFNNIYCIPNFKTIDIIDINKMTYNDKKPYTLCTFSRVNKKKGIEDLCKVLNKINLNHEEIIYTLDVYGPVEQGYEEEFEKIVDKYSAFMKYGGVVESNKSVDIISKYYMLVFPTKYKTEGIPGTILDAYAAGVPVLASEWDSCRDIVKNNITGIIYKFNDMTDLEGKLEQIYKSDIAKEMKVNCVEEAQLYRPEKIINMYFKYLA